MKKPGNLGAIAPPPRRAATLPALETVKASDQVPFNVRINADLATYVRMLSAKTRVPQYQLVERALELLRKDAGEI
jgi:hypothetical protein